MCRDILFYTAILVTITILQPPYSLPSLHNSKQLDKCKTTKIMLVIERVTNKLISIFLPINIMFITKSTCVHFDHQLCILPCSLFFLIVAIFLCCFASSLSNTLISTSSWKLHISVHQNAQYNLSPITITLYIIWAHILHIDVAQLF